VMHGTTSDDYCTIHRGTRVRKMHTSRRDAFQSINQVPLGKVDYLTRKIQTLQPYRRRGEVELEIIDKLESNCALVKYTPGSSPDILDYYIDKGYRGIVLEGYRPWACGIRLDREHQESHRGGYPSSGSLAMHTRQNMRSGIRYGTRYAGRRCD